MEIQKNIKGSDIGDLIGCVLGTADSAGLGFLGRVRAGTVTVIGTVSGVALGDWSGGGAGAASFCKGV